MTHSDETYLDNAATTEPYPEVASTVASAMLECYGNASARYDRGRLCKGVLERSREAVAKALGAEPCEVFFTSGGTESNNLAIAGTCRRLAAEGAQRGALIASALEHPSVTKTVRGMRREGWDVRYLDAEGGELDLDALRDALEASPDAKPALISVMTVQNELGYRFPVEKVAALRDELSPETLLHTDGVQAFGKVDFDPSSWGADLATVSAHKIGGPIGIGALFVRKDTPLFTNAFGGGQEHGLRSGTEPVPLIAGFAEAVRIAFARKDQAYRRVSGLKERLVSGLGRLRPDYRLNSRSDGSPYIVSFSIPGVDHGAAADFLNCHKVYVSKSSACHEIYAHIPPEQWRPKHPQSLEAAGIPSDLISSTFRVSFSNRSTQEDVERFLAVLGEYLDREGLR